MLVRIQDEIPISKRGNEILPFYRIYSVPLFPGGELSRERSRSEADCGVSGSQREQYGYKYLCSALRLGRLCRTASCVSASVRSDSQAVFAKKEPHFGREKLFMSFVDLYCVYTNSTQHKYTLGVCLTTF